jgi:hypothetical protein
MSDSPITENLDTNSKEEFSKDKEKSSKDLEKSFEQKSDKYPCSSSNEKSNSDSSSSSNEESNSDSEKSDKILTQKINLYDNKNFNAAMNESEKFKNSELGIYYQETLCLRDIKGSEPRYFTISTGYNNIKPFICNNLDEIKKHILCKKCVLPKGHENECNFNPILSIIKKDKKNEIIRGIISKIILSIYSTPGNDDYIFKNRCSRLFPIHISNNEERKIKNKTKKLKCAIPLRDFSTPFNLACCYLDWMVYLFNISGIEKYFDTKNRRYKSLLSILKKHKKKLIYVYAQNNRVVFSEKGYTICPVLRHVISIKNMFDIERDCRIDNDNFDIQLGHLINRRDNIFTIKGCNTIPMTREGNRILGGYNFCEDKWIILLKTIIGHY